MVFVSNYEPVHTYRIVLKTEVFLCLRKNLRSHVAFSNYFCLSTTFDVILFENSVFLCPCTRLQKNSLLEKSTYSRETVFKKLRFRLPKTPFTCRWKKLRFQKYADTCGRGLWCLDFGILILIFCYFKNPRVIATAKIFGGLSEINSL